MAIQVPQAYTQLNIPHWQVDNTEGLRALLQGSKTLGEGIAAPALAQRQHEAQVDLLNKKALAEQGTERARRDALAEFLKTAQKSAPPGSSISASPESGAVHIGVNPELAQKTKDDLARDRAQKGMMTQYTGAANKLDDQISAVHELQQLAKSGTALDRKVLTNAIARATGARAGVRESELLLQPGIPAQVATLFNYFGDSTSKALSDTQAKDVQALGRTLLEGIKDRHARMVATAQEGYPARLGQAPTVGTDRAKSIDEMMSQYTPKSPEEQALQQAPIKTVEAAQVQSPLDKLKSLFRPAPAPAASSVGLHKDAADAAKAWGVTPEQASQVLIKRGL